jgi:hypothetical protein
VSLLGVGAVDAAYLKTPVVIRLVVARISLQVFVYLGKECLSGHDYDGLRPADLVILIGDVLLAGAGDVLEGVEDGDEIRERLASAIVGVDNDAKVLEVVLQGDG